MKSPLRSKGASSGSTDSGGVRDVVVVSGRGAGADADHRSDHRRRQGCAVRGGTRRRHRDRHALRRVDPERDHRRSRLVPDQQPPAGDVPRHVLLPRLDDRAQRHHRRRPEDHAGVHQVRRRRRQGRGRSDRGSRTGDRSHVDGAGHHDRQGLPEEHPGAGPHVRRRARRRRRLAGRHRRRRVLGLDLPREPVLRRRRQHDGPDVRHRRLAGDQRLHRGDRDHHRRLQRRVRPRHRWRRQRRHQER
jgi:hypothetical protein